MEQVLQNINRLNRNLESIITVRFELLSAASVLDKTEGGELTGV